jgi:hypothetical protein
MNLHRWIGASTFAAALACAHAQAAQPVPRVVQVQPSGPEVPANLLRISIRFAAPVEGPLLGKLSLMHANGQRIEEPFLEQELWSPSGKVLTIMMHPGRVKTGLNAREAMGPILSMGDDVALAIDGRPIKRWSVGPTRGTGPVASAWTLSEVHAGSREPLVVRLDGPIDGRDADYLAIADGQNRRVPGHVQLTNGETTWTFAPRAPWQAGAYQLVARSTLEDAAGNRLGGHFETSIDSPQGRPVDIRIPFTAGRSSAKAGH